MSSQTWKYFDKITEGPNVKKSKCKICNRELKYTNSTGAMLNHLKLKHPTVLEVKQPSSSSSSSTNAGPSHGNTGNTVMNYLRRPCDQNKSNKITKLIAEMIYEDLLPIKLVESSAFKRLILFLEPDFKLPTRRSVTALLEKEYVECKSNLQSRLTSDSVSKISITTDCWTSMNTESFITVTCHYIDVSDSLWTMNSAVLGTRFVEESHTAGNLQTKIEEIIDEFEIRNRAFACVHDNAANISLAMENSTFFQYHIGCAAHTLQLSVNAGLNNDKIKKCIAAASRLVGHFKRSNNATNALRQKQTELNLPQHKLVQSVVTRWNSVFDMFNRLTEQRWATTAVLSDRNVTKLSDARTLELKDEDWSMIEDLRVCLRPLKDATEALSVDKDVSISVICPVITALVTKHLIVNADDSRIIKAFKSTVVSDLKKRYADFFKSGGDGDGGIKNSAMLLMTAAFLDPRHKHLPFISNEQVKTVIYARLREKVAATAATENTEIAPKEKIQRTSASRLLGDGYSRNHSNSAIVPANIDEVSVYLSLPIIDLDSKPLDWWNTNKNLLPNLSKIALNYLAVPSSSVPSERMFSSAGRLLTKLRSSLSSKHVDQILFLNKNMKQ